MICAIVTPEVAAANQFTRNGVHMVYFMEMINGMFATPIEMVALVPGAFPDYYTEDVSDSFFVKPDLEL